MSRPAPHRKRDSPAAGPQSLGQILSELMVRRGYARVQGVAALNAAWRSAAGETLAASSRPGQLKRGTLEVWVGHNLLAQELLFQKPALLAALQQALPDEPIHDLRFRVGTID